MSAQSSVPSIPPRPTRSQKQEPSSLPMGIPQVPPRPARRADRSISPQRDTYARSPLNEMKLPPASINIKSSGNSGAVSELSLSLPKRPPSVTLPSVGQEGNEYANVCEGNLSHSAADEDVSPTQGRNVANDLQLHAPKPSLPTASAKARVATVTRTDSSQAAAIGVGKALSPDDKDPQTRPLKSKTSFASYSSASTERPTSTQPSDSEPGIPEIGQRVPMYPNAGDVQAPSPSQLATPYASGVGYHNDGSYRASRHHGRTPSAREAHLPPGSYGLHGHGLGPHNNLEKAWYDKHPEALVKEDSGEYGPGIGGGKAAWALSSEDLNKIVRDTASRGAGFGTSPAHMGTPNEQIGYLASDEYTARMASPRPVSGYNNKAHSNSSQTHVESPLRKASLPNDDHISPELLTRGRDAATKKRVSEDAAESEVEDEHVIHIDPPSRRASKVGGGLDMSAVDLGPQGGNTSDEGGFLDERGYGVPILASDEISKSGEFMQPAISPRVDPGNGIYVPESDYPGSYYSGMSSRSGSRPTSQPASRPASIHGTPLALSRFGTHEEREDMHTPLEDVEEYEPLFPEDEEGGSKAQPQERPLTAADRLKRPELAKRKFPSHDIWEDAPSSARLQATVSTPEPEEDELTVVGADEEVASTVDPAFRQTEPAETDVGSFLKREPAQYVKPKFKSHLLDDADARPGMKQRFPSRDIWEDTPTSLRLETTLGDSLPDNTKSPQRPTTGTALLAQEKAGSSSLAAGEARPTTGVAAILEKSDKPSIPARPVKKGIDEPKSQPQVPPRPQRAQKAQATDLPASPTDISPQENRAASPPDSGEIEPVSTPTDERKAPQIPDRPKPQVPARPSKSSSRDSADLEALAKTVSGGSNASVGSVGKGTGASEVAASPSTKPKPAIPARPGGKIASLKAGFLSDLDKRLQLGPQAAKPQEKVEEPEKEEDRAPLSDARKGRARGPARRKPAASPAGVAEIAKGSGDASELGLSDVSTVWEIDESGAVVTSTPAHTSSTGQALDAKTSKDETPTLATNMAGEALISTDEIAPDAPQAAHPTVHARDEIRAREETQDKAGLEHSIGEPSKATGYVPKMVDPLPAAGSVPEESPEITSKVEVAATGTAEVLEPKPTSSKTTTDPEEAPAEASEAVAADEHPE